MTSLLILFVCHNNETIENIRTKYPDSTICFVGSSILSEEYQQDPKIITMRDLAINLEDKPKFLTFTAWYAISKNSLFQEYDYLAIFEYDVVLEENFEQNLREKCNLENADVISFSKIGRYFFWDIQPRFFYKFLSDKDQKYDILNAWYNTTNHCLKRVIIDEFVDWYYPKCIDFWVLDRKMVSWYHERLFSVFVNVFHKNVVVTNGLEHLQIGSHSQMNTQTEKPIPIELVDLYYKNTKDLETLEKIEMFYNEPT